jgi:hypothetical protein
MTNSTFNNLRDTKTILLTTHKRDGTPVGTPVSIAFDEERAFFRTWHKAGKAKRLRNNPDVEVAPANLRGEPSREPIRAHTRLLDGADAKLAARVLARRHRVLQRLLVPAFHRLMRYRTLHYELLPGTTSDPGAPPRRMAAG